MRFRQIHLDFHTSPLIPGIGEKFNKKKWQETLKQACVDSVTLFATCHHGYAYYNTKVGKRHPHLHFDLLRAQMDACKEIEIATPVYLSAGLNSLAGEEHPDWLEMESNGKIYDPFWPGFKEICFNSPYLDFFCDQIREVVTLFPDADGIFTDGVAQKPCCCPHCIAGMLREGLNPEEEKDRRLFADQVLRKYYKKATEAAKSKDPAMKIFHNSGHISIGKEELLEYFTHFELESLPTGGWGYDHYPMSAAYVRNLGKPFLGMTGKFHTTWGEFGGFKHPNALRYECCAMLANGSKCSIGDQLHPSGELDESTYAMIGEAYRDVKRKEAWCDHVISAAQLAVVSGIVPGCSMQDRELAGDTGAGRILLEAHIPFDVISMNMDFQKYEFLLLPDDVRITEVEKERLKLFLKNGGKIILSGRSGMSLNKEEFVLDLPFDHEGESPYHPDYVRAADAFAPEFVHTPFVMYLPSQRIKIREGTSLGKIYEPYFNRSYQHFSSHQHAPYREEPTEYDAGAMTGKILYFAHPVFSIYRAYGEVAEKEFIVKAIRRFMGNDSMLAISGLPSQGRVTLMKQPSEYRYVLHLLYANTILRGGVVPLSGGNVTGRSSLEIIEELNLCPSVKVSLRLPEKIHTVSLVPEEYSLKFQQDGERLEFCVSSFVCHAIVALSYGKKEMEKRQFE